jgi:hypothetical protein
VGTSNSARENSMVPTFLRQVNGDEQRQSSLPEGLVVREGARTSSKSAVMVRSKQGRQRSLISLVDSTNV